MTPTQTTKTEAMSTKLNAEALAAQECADAEDKSEPRSRWYAAFDAFVNGAAWQREHSQPIADERDELRRELEGLVYDLAGEQHDFDEISKAFCRVVAARIENARAILNKYPKTEQR